MIQAPPEVCWDPEHSGGCWRARGQRGNSSCLTLMGVFCHHSQMPTHRHTSPFMLEHVKLLRIPQGLEKIPIMYVTSNNRGLPPSFPYSLEVGLPGTCEASLLPTPGYLLQLQTGQPKADVHIVASSQNIWVFGLPQCQSSHRWLWSKKQKIFSISLGFKIY